MAMRFWTAYAFLALTTVTNTFAAPGGTGGHLSDLIAPAINLSILLGVLGWKLKGPLKNYFTSKADEISNTMERVNLKSKEAQMMLENEERKASNLDSEIKAIHQQVENEVLTYEKNLSRETEEKTQKLKSDANLKLQADNKAALDELNAELLNEVVKKTKNTIKTNQDYQNKVSSK